MESIFLLGITFLTFGIIGLVLAGIKIFLKLKKINKGKKIEWHEEDKIRFLFKCSIFLIIFGIIFVLLAIL